MGQSDLPLASGKRHQKSFERLGWESRPKRGKGSHIVLTQPGNPYIVCIPDHKEVSRALLAKQIKGAGLTEDDYLAAFE